MISTVKTIHTLGPSNTNCESAARTWFKTNKIENGEIILYQTLEDALEAMPKTEEHALLGCVVYPDLHSLVFSNLDKLKLADVFIHNTYEMILASRFNYIEDIKTVTSHPAPSGLISKNYKAIKIIHVNSNAQAAIDCVNGVSDGCITTMPAAISNKLNVIKNFGVVPMGFTIHVTK
ncbi:prephenate dehydratase domain-containing protein [Snodgrassella sp.]|jgi:prephenate dehydratase|uniref:prephenate dehydratase domain-containing protein n=1 Tax=Snodgrassella sp. TaxID=2815304 RepID=UPI00258A32F4|nr:prephenate dehydratase domain-containing protein [Snodgrassella sp.]MCO6525800.1 hypothetical protein [Snodgrassella sp.]